MKRYLIGAILLLLSFSLYSLDIFVAPVMHIDESENLQRNTVMVQGDLLRSLRQAEAGMELNFFALSDKRINPPVSITEAVSVCRNERADYLLYGYITKKTYTVEAEIRLFDYGERSIRQVFYSMDDSKNYERVISDLSAKIHAYISKTFNLNILTDSPSYAHLALPVGAGYWTPMSPQWTSLMIGTVKGNTGFTLIPNDRCFTVMGKAFYFSLGLELAYRLGLNKPDVYKAWYHSMIFSFPVRMHMGLWERHQVYIGAAFNYFVDILDAALKYREKENLVYNNPGFNLRFGYQFILTPKLVLYFNNSFDFLFIEKPLIAYSPGLGAEIRFYSKELKQKW